MPSEIEKMITAFPDKSWKWNRISKILGFGNLGAGKS